MTNASMQSLPLEPRHKGRLCQLLAITFEKYPTLGLAGGSRLVLGAW